MFTHKQLTLLAASVIAAGLFLAQPARALTLIAQSYLVSSWDGGNAVKPIGRRRCYTYRDGRRVHRPCAPRGYRYSPFKITGTGDRFRFDAGGLVLGNQALCVWAAYERSGTGALNWSPIPL